MRKKLLPIFALLCLTVSGAWATGELDGVFSVSASKQVCFSKGNLRYESSAWSFFAKQYDYYTSYSADAWDKFGWSTSSPTYGMNTSTSNGDYSGNFVEWGATMGSGWFTLSSAEWTYLFNTRTTGGTVFGTSSARYAHATINTDGTSVNGIILFPDGVDIESTEVTNAGTVNGTSAWSTKCTTAEWIALEVKGCVFLPAAGYRYGESIQSAGSYGDYWSATANGESNAVDMYFQTGSLNPSGDDNRNSGKSVRLVIGIYTVTYDANGGTGSVASQTKVSSTDLTLASNSFTRKGYTFNGWNTAADGSGTSYAEGANYTADASVTLYAQWRRGWATDELDGVFSVSAGKQVHFSKGNLRYASGTWSLFDNQYNYYNSYSGDAWDKFGWSSTGTTYGMSTSQVESTYYGDYVEWGNTIGSGWYTLSSDEWDYLLNTRTTSSGIRYAKATVNGVDGLVLLPDDWNESYYSLASTNTENARFDTNVITAENWTDKLEINGAVLLPVTGYRDGTSIYSSATMGCYWSSSGDNSDSNYAYQIWFTTNVVETGSHDRKYTGSAVRLVKTVAMTLDETVDNTACLTAENGNVCDVTLTRTLRTGAWNTFCTPFNISASTLTDKGITAVKELTASSFNSGTGALTLTFSDASSIEAGKPYLVQVSSDVANPTFTGVTVKSTTTPTETTAVNFIPTLGQTEVTGTQKEILFLAAENKLKHPNADNASIKGFRAYFLLLGDAADARTMTLDLGDGETTGIQLVQDEGLMVNGSSDYYDLQGRRVAQPTKKGLYIQNGRKVIIK